jgi:hypothetical protein
MNCGTIKAMHKQEHATKREPIPPWIDVFILSLEVDLHIPVKL